MSSGKFRKEISPRLFRKAKYGVDKFILVQKSKIHFVEAGAGEPVILIPGSYGTYRAWNCLLPLLGGEYRLLALDYGGTGDPDKPDKGPDYPVREQTDLIARMVQQMGLDKVNLIGGSEGGAIVFDFAARYPDLVNKIVSIEGGIIRPDKIKGDPREYRLKVPVIGDLFVQVIRTGESSKPISSMAKSAARIPWYKVSVRNNSQNIEEEAKSIRSPVLYLYGTESDYKRILPDKNIEYLKNYLPHAWIVALEGGIQDLAVEKPAEVANLILEFLRKRPAPRD